MVSVPSTHLVLFIASIAVAAGVAGAFTTEASRLSGTFEEAGVDLTDEVDTDIDIVTDPGGAVLQSETDVLSIHVLNRGERSLPADAEQIDVFVDGRFQPSADLTVTPLDAASWAPDTVVRIDIEEPGLSGGDHRIKVVVDGDAEVMEFRNCQGGGRDHLVFQDQANNELAFIDRTGSVSNLGVSTKGFGPYKADFECDVRIEVPYVTENNQLAMIDLDGETQTLSTSNVRNDIRVGVGDLDGDGSPAALYPRTNDNNDLYRVEFNGADVEVMTEPTDSIAGLADFNGDGDLDLIFTNTNGDLLYYENQSVIDTGVNPECGMCIGAPADFDGDGTPRVPYKGANGAILLADHQGNSEEVWNDADEPLGSLGTFDWNEDGTPDIVIVYNADKKLYWIDYATGTRNGPIQDSTGSDVQGDAYGVA